MVNIYIIEAINVSPLYGQFGLICDLDKFVNQECVLMVINQKSPFLSYQDHHFFSCEITVDGVGLLI